MPEPSEFNRIYPPPAAGTLVVLGNDEHVFSLDGANWFSWPVEGKAVTFELPGDRPVWTTDPTCLVFLPGGARL